MLELRIEILGEVQYKTLRTMNTIASSFFTLGGSQEAGKLREKVLVKQWLECFVMRVQLLMNC